MTTCGVKFRQLWNDELFSAVFGATFGLLLTYNMELLLNGLFSVIAFCPWFRHSECLYDDEHMR
jgi:hypothetical protein